MSQEIKQIARCLSAPGYTLKNGKTTLLVEQDGILVEQSISDGKVQNEVFVTADVRADTPATYITTAKKIMCFSVDENNNLKAVEFNPKGAEGEQWVDMPLTGLGDIKLMPKGKLTGTTMADGAILFYQGADGKIQSLRYRNDTEKWEKNATVPASPAAGSALSVLQSDNHLGVFFMGNDGKVNGQLRSFDTGNWNSVVFSGSNFNTHVQSFTVTQDPKSRQFESFVLTNNMLYHLDDKGTKKELGSVHKGDFSPTTKEQNTIMINGNNYGNIYQTTYYGGGGYCGYPVYYPPYSCRPCW